MKIMDTHNLDSLLNNENFCCYGNKSPFYKFKYNYFMGTEQVDLLFSFHTISFHLNLNKALILIMTY